MFQRCHITSRNVARRRAPAASNGQAKRSHPFHHQDLPMPTFRPALPTFCAAVFGAAALLALPGALQARERQTTVTGADGQTATRNVVREHADVASTTTGPKATRSRVVDRSRGGAEATVTGRNGGTVTRSTVRAAGSTSHTITGPQGQTRGVAVTRQP
jgi:hypothetical protein